VDAGYEGAGDRKGGYLFSSNTVHPKKFNVN